VAVVTPLLPCQGSAYFPKQQGFRSIHPEWSKAVDLPFIHVESIIIANAEDPTDDH
jgi:hypothetical protein